MRLSDLLKIIAGLACLVAGPAKAGPVSGDAAYSGQTLAFTQGLAWWDAGDGEVRVALFDHAPPDGALESLRSGEWGEGGPTMTLRLRFEAGAAPGLSSVTYCYLDFDFPRGGPMGINTDAKGCGLMELGPGVGPGGEFAARLEGRAPGPGDKPFQWRVRFSLPVAR